MKETARKFFSIIKEELWGTPADGIEISTKEYQAMHKMAAIQGVSGMLARCICEGNVKANLSPSDAAAAFVTYEKTKALNKTLNKKIIELNNIMSGAGIRYFVLKGQPLANIYRNPYTRQAGDIDFYIPPSEFERAENTLLSTWGVNLKNRPRTMQHFEFKRDGICYEMHFTPSKFFSKSNQRYFNSITAESKTAYIDIEANDGSTIDVPVFEPAVNLAYTFVHAWHHMLTKGIALKHICDIAVLISHYQNQDDKIKAIQIFERLGYLNAFKAFEAIAVDFLGLDKNKLTVETTYDRKLQEKIMDMIMLQRKFGLFQDDESTYGLRHFVAATTRDICNNIYLYHLAPKELRARLIWQVPTTAKFILTKGKR